MSKDAKVEFDEKVACDRCGTFGAFLFETEKLCADCYGMRASCCAEFGGDDLTTTKAASAPLTDASTVRDARTDSKTKASGLPTKNL
jgi:hypothetical protein